MADPLSLAASVAGLISLAIELTKITSGYVGSAKDAPAAIEDLQHETRALTTVLEALCDFLDQQPPTGAFRDTSVLLPAVTACEKKLRDLCHLLQESAGGTSRFTRGIHRLKWPLREDECRQTVESLHRYTSIFQFSLTKEGCELLSKNSSEVSKILADQVTMLEEVKKIPGAFEEGAKSAQEVRKELLDILNPTATTIDTIADDVVEIKELAQKESDAQILQWLSSVDQSNNQHSAQKRHEPSTGDWLLAGTEFNTWKTTPGSLLWIHGIPGAGKTIIASTIIDHLQKDCAGQADAVVAYFYFDFADQEKRRVGNFLGSLLRQLCLRTVPPAVKTLYDKMKQASPSIEDLTKMLEATLRSLTRVYIVVDALDECDEKEELEELIERINGWGIGHLHFICTSRPELYIQEFISPLTAAVIDLQKAQLDKDIRIFIDRRLSGTNRRDSNLSKWSKQESIKAEIYSAIAEKANGMFRWVTCQWDEMRKCRTPRDLMKTLNSLPPTLDETYERILYQVDPKDSGYVKKVLQWLTFSIRPMKIGEIRDALAVEVEGDQYFDPLQRMHPRDILDMCSSLVRVVSGKNERERDTDEESWTTHEEETRDDDDEQTDLNLKESDELRLAHFSVKEFLTSERIQSGNAREYTLEQVSSHTTITETCLCYVLHSCSNPPFRQEIHIMEHPFLPYAALYWITHIKSCELDAHPNSKTLELSFNLLEDTVIYETYIETCSFICENDPNLLAVDLWHNWHLLEMQNTSVPSALYFSSSIGFGAAIKILLQRGAEVNTKEGYRGNALLAAVCRGGEQVVKQLLEAGAEVNAQGGMYRNALQTAAFFGNEQAVKQLLEAGAEINTQGGCYGNALQAAASQGHQQVVKLLLEAGAEINAQGGKYGNALHAAALCENEHVVKQLLEAGAEVNVQGGLFGSALQAAAHQGNESIVQLLLKWGADDNAEGGHIVVLLKRL